ncbi:MAG: O-antigen ligase family protein [Thermoplasmatota archaeon]
MDPINTRYYGFGEDASYAGATLAMALCMAVAYIVRRPPATREMMLLLAAGLIAAGLLLTIDVTAFISAGLGIAIVMRRSGRRARLIGACVIALAAIIAIFESGLLAQAVARATAKFAGGDRLSAWAAALAVFPHYPITGVGFKGYEDAAFAAGIQPPAHTQNTVLGCLVYLGIAGGVLMVMLLLGTGLSLIEGERKLWRSKASEDIHSFALGAAALAAIFIAFGMTEEAFSSAQVSLAFWPIAGLALSRPPPLG